MVAVPVNAMLAPDVLTWAIDRVRPSLAVVDGGLYPRGAEVFASTGVRVGATIRIGGEGPPGVPALTEWIGDKPTTEVDVTIHGDDIWELLFTSGTTSMPKASMTSHSYSYLSGYVYGLSLTRGLKYETDLVYVTFLPIVYHCGHNSTVMVAALAGGTVVIGRRPDEQALAQAITREKATAIWAGSPQWVEKLVQVAEQRPDVDLSSLTVVMFSWGAMKPDLGQRLKKVVGDHVQMLEVFGQTESMSCYRFWPEANPEHFAESLRGINHVGRPTPLLAADVVGPDGKSLRGQPGQPGEAVYRSPMITQGYYRDPEATAEAFAGGWFHSGDSCAYVDDGSQIMVDRLKDIVKSGGENVSSIRVEGVISGHPEVARVAVVGLPDERWGERVTAVVIRKPGSQVTEEEIIRYARERLAGFETPKQVVFVEEFPETVGGKVRKHVLRAQLSQSAH